MKKLLVLGLTAFLALNSNAQSYRPVLTGAPFLRISPDARAGGLGDMGVATSADAFSQYWNPAKYVFSESHSGVGVSYTPYLGKITDDVFLLNGTFHTYLGEEERSALGVSIYYFNIGEVKLNGIVAGSDNIVSLGTAKPNEFSLDVSYGLRLTDNYGMAVAGRYIRSDLNNNDQNATTKAANSFAVDVAGFYQSGLMTIGNINGKLRAGFNISNIGPKLDYSDSDELESFLPTNLRLGTTYDFLLDDVNKITVGAEFNKLLVPTPSELVKGQGNPYYKVPNKGVVSGIFGSLNDAPDGFSEELKEITWALSAEYVYNNAFAFRTGYFHESVEKGARQYATLGAGFKFNSFGLDLSYLIPTNSVNNALQNTLRFGLTWDFGGEAFNNN
ncbi:type IX secretion system outer membrane channel protein PorV [Ornithobacterium rhinotracheale]|uniref:Type IX secretion system protein PorV domain-containing protein n=1 Tax=Ornithobacterium rhinotracheale (strain ATCC 51463 / DSM 15997 / CCUG 23171 / CIP 104009 / LMG 9086) TaxID=867902 RepID=I4A238_ORNRL|nr:type IX secretion system outer membrane channel protein PorV [Ornithobacterium rhinotracheale]AFL98022.1 hypothetical protein Ornrh_1877 [Ornithobacterium rhinotracheale DSM 15997]AIP99799.1 hypothetical protein Q785_09235 [Ornithobacterium rhinotracheale ORT-UMN 88]KGB66003.1 hypothetical protein Q787_09050 [Ornithobacterium rhinotracheale H06-030791]MCK0193686.1 type IX secretion system outer membrane channel protein PorV [Ornithobacterium rhinotracheale]MCK0199320.1 type IX secretion sys